MGFLDDLVSPSRRKKTVARALQCCQNSSNTSVLEFSGNNLQVWKPNLETDQLLQFLRQTDREVTVDQDAQTLRIFFISGTRSKASYHVHIDPRILTLLCETAGMSEKFLSDIYETEEWTRLPFGYANSREDTRVNAQSSCRDALSVHYGFWSWDLNPDSSHSFIHSRSCVNSTTYFCVNFPPVVTERIVSALKHDPSLQRRPFWVDVLVTDELLDSYRAAISKRNQSLIRIEKQITDSSIEEQTRFLHDLSVNWHTIFKDLIDMEEQIQNFMKLCREIRGQTPDEVSQTYPCDSEQAFAHLLSKCQFYCRWAMTYRDRTTGRINLLHHLAAQQDNRVNQHIANVSTEIGMQTQRDSASMFTLAVVTTVFLPPTFVASFLSMPFFSADDNSLGVTKNVWLFAAVAIPLTIVVLAIWIFWFRWRLKRDRSVIQQTKDNIRYSPFPLEEVTSHSTKRTV